ncbi:hypothetical protein ACJMK2_027308 [Sinanodonta woodiana]|uniref:Methionyl-tRNA formyltransferase, mitochondrial n=1 Tax=Sinanodonta woodiana TaxID=1069815 RepID=A0ABD3XP16_SINWO
MSLQILRSLYVSADLEKSLYNVSTDLEKSLYNVSTGLEKSFCNITAELLKSLFIQDHRDHLLSQVHTGPQRSFAAAGSYRTTEIICCSRFHTGPQSSFAVTGSYRTTEFICCSRFIQDHRVHLLSQVHTGPQSSFAVAGSRNVSSVGVIMAALVVCCRGRNLYSKLPIHRQLWLHKTCSWQISASCDTCTMYSGLKSVAGRRTLVERASQIIRSNPPWRILFFGTDNFAIATLKALNENRICQSSRLVETLEVVSIKGQTPVRKYSEEVGLCVYDWPFKSVIDQYDVGVVISFGHMIPDSIIHMFPYGILNVHPSLLPRWRGASPIIHTILNGDMETGISVMEIRPRHFDIGPLLMQRKYPVSDRMTAFGLADILAPFGGQLLLKCLENLPTLENCEVEQTNRGVTYAHKIVPVMSNIDWVNQTCVDIDRQYRAIHEIYPLRSSWNGNAVKLLNMIHPKDLSVSHVQSVLSRFWPGDIAGLLPGMPVFDKEKNCLLVRCKDGMVGFTHVIIKKKMNAQAFYNGYMSNPQHRGICFESIPNHLNKDIFREKTLVYSGHMHNRSM